MQFRFAPALAAGALLLACALASAQPMDVGGVKYPATSQVGGQTLQLNGAGMRYKFVIKVYTAGLYLPAKSGTTDGVLAQNGARRVHVVMQREIDANEFGKMFTRGMQDNAPKDEFSKFIPGTIKLGEIFGAYKKLKAGDVFFLDYVPGQGTTVVVNGKPASDPIKEPEFFNALLRIWIGNNPADGALKEAMLGREARPVTSPGQQ
ncbi:MAG: chalcone isomerase family protein [Rubrivivax sp.]